MRISAPKKWRGEIEVTCPIFLLCPSIRMPAQWSPACFIISSWPRFAGCVWKACSSSGWLFSCSIPISGPSIWWRAATVSRLRSSPSLLWSTRKDTAPSDSEYTVLHDGYFLFIAGSPCNFYTCVCSCWLNVDFIWSFLGPVCVIIAVSTTWITEDIPKLSAWGLFACKYVRFLFVCFHNKSYISIICPACCFPDQRFLLSHHGVEVGAEILKSEPWPQHLTENKVSQQV